MRDRTEVATSSSEEHKSRLNSADGERVMLCQPTAIAAAGTAVLTDCQPARTRERVTLSRGDINNFVDWAREESEETNETVFDLSSWVALESLKTPQKGVGLSRKLTVAFAIGKLLQHLKGSVMSYSQAEILRLCSVDNFEVKMVANGACDDGWEVVGVDMVSPSMSMQVMLNCMDAVVTRHSPFCCAKKTTQGDRDNDSALCYVLGLLVRFIFSDGSLDSSGSNSQENPQETQNQNYMNDFLRSLSISPSRMNMNTNGPDSSDGFEYEPSRPTKSIRVPSQFSREGIPSLDMPVPITALVRDLLACRDANDIFQSDTLHITLDAAIDDLHMLLIRPDQFLFGASQQLPTVTKMYGRSSESSVLLDAFRRVTTSGQSEAFFMKGFSGSGKTRLVQCAVDAAVAARGLVVEKKFEANSTNQLYLVLSAFNDLCEQLATKFGSTKGGTSKLWHKIVMEFGSSIHMLANILPSIIRLAPSPTAAYSFSIVQGTKGDVNFFSLCDIIKHFMRVLSTSSIPVLMVLDDLQWGDSVSLGVVHTVLSDRKGASCILFVGCYRSNEIHENHVLHGFQNWLSSYHVPSSTIRLDGISQENVLSLISDSLGMLPRLCQSLSRVIYRKTEGNPLFVQTFLRSLVDKQMLMYSPRERSWVWDIDEIRDEGITPNVLDLLGAKMAACSSGLKVALKVASCFGLRVDKTIVKILSGTSQYYSLPADLNKAVDYGMIDLDSGSNYKFVHDQVREAAYDMIDPDTRDEFHFNIGMLLYSSFKKQSVEVEGKNGILFYTMLEQIHHGVPDLLQDEEQRVMIAEMNYDVASQMMESYNYTDAYQFAERAVALLPKDCWSQSCDMTINIYFLLSKTAYSNGKTDIAMSAISKVIKHTNSMKTPQLKLDAYKLKHDIILDSLVPGEMAALMNPIIDTLASLGEVLKSTDELCESTVFAEFRLASEMFEIESDDALSRAYRVDSCVHTPVMEAYYILVNLAYSVKPKLCPYFVTRWAMYTLRNKVMCKYTPAAYVSFAVVLCKDMNCHYMNLGHRIGKLGLKIMHEEGYESMLPTVYLSYYGYVGCLFEPLQAVIDMHQRAIDTSFNLGNSSIAALHEGLLVVRKRHAGTNLLQIKEMLERGMNIQDHPGSSAVLQITLREHYEGVCALIGEVEVGRSSDTKFDNKQTICPYNISRMMTCCYLGHYERAVYMAKQWDLSRNDTPKTLVQFRRIYATFYYGLSCIGLRRQKNTKPRQNVAGDKLWLDFVSDAARCSRYNFENKRALLMAEKLSCSCDNARAEKMYDTAIEASKSSHFVHEEALSCELAGAHYERLGKFTKSLELYKQAESCYEIWGSIVKTRQMKEKVDRLEKLIVSY